MKERILCVVIRHHRAVAPWLEALTNEARSLGTTNDLAPSQHCFQNGTAGARASGCFNSTLPTNPHHHVDPPTHVLRGYAPPNTTLYCTERRGTPPPPLLTPWCTSTIYVSEA